MILLTDNRARRELAVFGHAQTGLRYRGEKGPDFATWLYPPTVFVTGDDRRAFRLTDCGGWWAYVAENFTTVSGEPCPV